MSLSIQSTPILASSFDYSGQLLASAIQSLDRHEVRVHQISYEGPSVQISSILLKKGTTVTSIAWASFSSSNNKNSTPQKKRKRASVSRNGTSEDLVVVIGTNKGNIQLFSPNQGEIVKTIADVHSVPITSVSVQDVNKNSVWSCDHSGLISQWNLLTQTVTRKPFSTSEPDVRILQPISTKAYPDHLLVASTNVYLVNPSQPAKTIKSLSGFVNPVTNMIQSTSNPDIVFTSSDNERNVNVVSLSKGKTIGILVAGSNVQSVVVSDNDDALAAVMDNGAVELFFKPVESFSGEQTMNGSNKRANSAVPTVKSASQFKIIRPQSAGGHQIKIENVYFSHDCIAAVWLEAGSVPAFEKIRYMDDNQPVTGSIEITRERLTNTVSAANNKLANERDPAAVVPYNEARSIVNSGKDLQGLEVDKEEVESEEEDEGTLADRLEALEVNNKKLSDATKSTVNGKLSKDFKNPGSFSVVLSQALKSNDHSLFEECLTNRKEEAIKYSIQRLDSSLAVKLLERLADKIARSPSQASQLNIWLKWVMIAHGGYLVSIPNLLKTLSSLHSTLADRVAALPRLLSLQGRLEMLNSQMELRKDIYANSQVASYEDDEDEDEAAVEYIEDGAFIVDGEDNEEDDEDEEDDSDEEGFLNIEAEGDGDEEEYEDEDEYGNSDVEDNVMSIDKKMNGSM